MAVGMAMKSTFLVWTGNNQPFISQKKSRKIINWVWHRAAMEGRWRETAAHSPFCEIKPAIVVPQLWVTIWRSAVMWCKSSVARKNYLQMEDTWETPHTCTHFLFNTTLKTWEASTLPRPCPSAQPQPLSPIYCSFILVFLSRAILHMLLPQQAADGA